MNTRPLSAVVTAGLLALLIDAQAGACATMAAPDAARKAQSCSQACLAKAMADFKASVLARKTAAVADAIRSRDHENSIMTFTASRSFIAR